MDAEPELKDPSILDLLYFCPLIYDYIFVFNFHCVLILLVLSIHYSNSTLNSLYVYLCQNSHFHHQVLLSKCGLVNFKKEQKGSRKILCKL